MASHDQDVERTLRAIADPARRRILRLLKQKGSQPAGGAKGMCAGEIEGRVNLSQSTVSHHMGVLTKAGLVHARKIDQWRWYTRNPGALKSMMDALRKDL